MKKLLVLFLVSMMAFTACSKKEEAATDAKADATAEAKANDAKDPFEGVERDANALRTFLKDKSPEEKDALLMQALKHADPKLRAVSYSVITGHTSKDGALIYINVLKEEKDPTVLVDGLRALKGTPRLDPTIVDFYKEAAKHENAEVRRAAISGLLNTNNTKKGIAFTAEEAIKLLDDKDADVRKTVCGSLGENFPDATLVIPVYEKLLMGTADAPADKNIVSSCMNGLLYMWYNSEVYVPEAYDLTVKYFEHTPRTKDWPNPFTMELLKRKPRDAWKKLVPDFDGKKLVDAMKSIAKDDNANEGARVRAVGIVGILGTKADVEELKNIENAEVQGEVVDTLKGME